MVATNQVGPSILEEEDAELREYASWTEVRHKHWEIKHKGHHVLNCYGHSEGRAALTLWGKGIRNQGSICYLEEVTFERC